MLSRVGDINSYKWWETKIIQSGTGYLHVIKLRCQRALNRNIFHYIQVWAIQGGWSKWVWLSTSCQSTTSNQYEESLFWGAINIREELRQIYSNLLHNKTCGCSSKPRQEENRLVNEWPPGFQGISAEHLHFRKLLLFWIIGNRSIECSFAIVLFWLQVHLATNS